jgi:NAD(P)-dependent dehydrogenase (short-subunit alcohol dehydrogenase family)
MADRQAREGVLTMPADSLSKLSLDGKTAVITGATQGLGEAIARLFAERGCANIVVVGRNEERGEKVRADLEAKGVHALFVQADLADFAAVRKIIPACEAAFGRIDILVNAAGLTDRGSIWDTSEERFDALFDVNAKAPFFLMQDALHLMKKTKTSGTIVNILSMAAHGGQSFIAAYSGAKGALAVLTRNAANAVLNYRIRINGLNIGWMDTPGEDRIMKTYHDAETGWLTKAEAGRPFGRLLKPAEVARAVAFLASDESGMMTGTIIDMDQQVLGAADSTVDPPKAEW